MANSGPDEQAIMVQLPVRLDRADPTPLTAQLAGQVRALVTGGLLARGDRVPSTRALAAELGVSRSVPEHAYDQLLAEGWLEGRVGAGTFVTGGPARTPAPTPAATPETASGPGPLVALDTGTPWIDPRQDRLWRRAWREVSAARPPRGYTDPRGLPALREVLAERLSRSRGLSCTAADVVVTTGTADGLRQLLAQLPVGPVAVEDPGYRAAVAVVGSLGRLVVDLPAEHPVEDLRGVVAAYVTPAHQHPLGTTMSGPARLGLLAAAERAAAVVVEDDYDSEFRYDVAPVPALASLDRQRVAYLGTASKSVLPSLRLGWLVAPDPVREPLDRLRAATHESASWPVQLAFLTLLRDGYVDRVVHAARRVYADRSRRVHEALAAHGETDGPAAGMYLTLRTSAEAASRARDAARAAGFAVPLLADYCRSADLAGLVVGFGGCTEEELDRVLEVLATSLSREVRERP